MRESSSVSRSLNRWAGVRPAIRYPVELLVGAVIGIGLGYVWVFVL